MKKKFLPWIFLLCLVVFFFSFDGIIAYFGEEVWPYGYNDYEATRVHHPEEVWDKVFFGNSAVISAYREDYSEAGYVNLGMDYAVVTDLWDLLRKGHLKVGSDLVVGLNLFTLYDNFDTNPAYIWHRGTLEPYTYFHRDKLMRIVKDTYKLHTGQLVTGMGKILYYGSMSDAQLQEKMDVYQEKYFSLPIEEFQENISALEHIADWCEKEGVRLRILWMPFNPSVERPALLDELMLAVEDWCSQRQIEWENYTDLLDETCFHDVGHLNYEHGAYVFTEEVDQWLQN